jgi:hypothetical protein
MSLLVTIILILIVGSLIFVAVRYVLEALSVPEPFNKIILALVILLIAVWIAERAGLF